MSRSECAAEIIWLLLGMVSASLERLQRRLQPGEQEVVDLRKLDGEQAQERNEDKGPDPHPEIQSEFVRSSVCDPAEERIGEHLAIHDTDDQRNRKEERNQQDVEALSRLE